MSLKRIIERRNIWRRISELERFLYSGQVTDPCWRMFLKEEIRELTENLLMKKAA